MMYVANRETGTFIVPVSSIEVGMDVIALYEKDDKENGEYVPDFYDIVDDNHVSLLRNDYAFQTALDHVIRSGKPLKFTT